MNGKQDNKDEGEVSPVSVNTTKTTTNFWRISREIPSSLVLLAATQTALLLFGLGAGYQRFEDLEKLRQNVYTRSDAAKEREIFDLILKSVQSDNLECEKRLGKIEEQLERHTDRDLKDDLRRPR